MTGPNASGKGTVAQRLLTEGMVRHHVSMGQLLRDVAQEASNTPDQKQVLDCLLGSPDATSHLEHCLRNRLLIPDAWTEALIELYLKNHPELHTSVWLLDGYPRRLEAAKHLMALLDELNIPLLHVLHLRVPEAEVLRRSLLRKREDDNKETIRSRYRIYEQEILPVVEHLEALLGTHQVSHIDASTDTGQTNSREIIYQRVKYTLSSAGLTS
ncbi:adenylate kinase [Deinococcus cellulosilyticus NBRC 106333 = KACC 11606]|uniref:Adenylate kinase n=1 Tax=Deinococcus cellulosilyticus (strain DSM 18568 / NBRC 106333 / KACC 11606 / 5516J-15) TaxID=1223518 RepID=A0A511N587_DEIC1|nr:adenylate kinase [Deinococcus cellulosilyticus NBRC 106333 = KACC 11606]